MNFGGDTEYKTCNAVLISEYPNMATDEDEDDMESVKGDEDSIKCEDPVQSDQPSKQSQMCDTLEW